MSKWAFVVVVFLLLALQAAVSATYYIDFSSGADSNNGTAKSTPWKCAPGMVKFSHSGYVHSAGDQFIFKGGVTWDNTCLGTASTGWSITNGGSAGNIDTYTIDQTWFSGGSYTAPIIARNGTITSANAANIQVTGSYVTINGFSFQNFGPVGGSQNSTRTLFGFGNHDFTVSNNIFNTNDRIAIWLTNSSQGTAATLHNITISGNDISNVAWGIGMSPGAANSVYDTVAVNNNVFHDFSSAIGGTTSGNGIHCNGMIIFNSSGTDTTQRVTNLAFHDNSSYGNFSRGYGTYGGCTAFLYYQDAMGAASTALIYNNHFTYTTASPGNFSNCITVGAYSGAPTSGAYVFNNSCSVDANTAYGFWIRGTSSLIENNIIKNPSTGFLCDGASFCPTTDYNDVTFSGSCYAVWNGSTHYTTLATFQSGTSQEAHGINADPAFVSPLDLHLTSGSRAIASGTNLSAYFSTDADGNTRPTITPWDMGAYEFQVQGAPKPPSNLQATPN